MFLVLSLGNVHCENVHSLLRWNIFLKKYTKTLSIFNFGKSTGDFHDCYMFRKQSKILVLKCYCSFTQHFILVSIFEFAVIYPEPVFAIHILVPVHHILLCNGLYFCLCLLAIYNTFPSLFSVLNCSTVFAVIMLLLPFHLHILYLIFINNHSEFLFLLF